MIVHVSVALLLFLKPSVDVLLFIICSICLYHMTVKEFIILVDDKQYCDYIIDIIVKLFLLLLF